MADSTGELVLWTATKKKYWSFTKMKENKNEIISRDKTEKTGVKVANDNDFEAAQVRYYGSHQICFKK
jgi:hypothetical protein